MAPPPSLSRTSKPGKLGRLCGGDTPDPDPDPDAVAPDPDQVSAGSPHPGLVGSDWSEPV
ncbi:MAG: hypothetical protein NVSMB9_06540 [Isosphaeraceae bacterium]